MSIRGFIVGETIHLTAHVSHPGGRAPYDADVVKAIPLGSDNFLTEELPFTKEKMGVWKATLETAGRDPGTYNIVVIATKNGDPEQVRIIQDRFTLKSLD